MIFLSIVGCAKQPTIDSVVDPIWIIEAKYQQVHNFRNGLAIVNDGEAEYAINKTGDIIFSENFYSDRFNNGVAVVKQDDEHKYMFLNGAVFEDAYEYFPIFESHNPDFLLADRSLLNHQQMPYYGWEMGIHFDFNEDGYAGIGLKAINESWIINLLGDMWEVPASSFDATQDWAVIAGPLIREVQLYNYESGRSYGPFDRAKSFRSGYAAFQINDLWGYLREDGTTTIEVQYTYAGNYYDGIAPVTTSAGLQIIDETGQKVKDFSGIFTEDEFRYGALICSAGKNMGLLSTEGIWIVSPSAGVTGISWDYKSNLFKLFKGVKMGIYIPEADILIEPIYDTIQIVSANLAVVSKNGKYGLLDYCTDSFILKPSFDYIGDYGEGLFVAREKRSDFLGYIDEGGAWIHAPQFISAGQFNEGLAAVKLSNTSGYIGNPNVYNHDGTYKFSVFDSFKYLLQDGEDFVFLHFLSQLHKHAGGIPKI